ncbi:MAG: gonadoliberin III [Nevskiaceae bacterium]|nr:MAG: gonadoliberin III [Nevskiaceae bacterium]TBR74607.1 MAG: gonadoliberin III [Nevskiaceae bacterium]
MSKISFYVIVVLLIAIGVGTAWTRHTHTGEAFLPGTQRVVWQVEARVHFTATGDPVKVSLALPDATQRFSLFNERATSPGYGFAIVEKNHQPRGEWTKGSAQGPQTLYYKAEFVAQPRRAGKPLTLHPFAVEPVDWPEPAATAARQLLDAAREKSSDPASLIREIVKLLHAAPANQDAALLLDQGIDKAHLVARLLNQADVPARVLMGLYLEDARRRQSLSPMVEVYTPQEMIVVNPDTGEQGLPDNLLLWNEDDAGILDVTGGHHSSVKFSMIQRLVPARQIAQAQDSLFNILGVHILPIESQSMFKMLFLLPIGALVVVFMRLIVGIKTSGTFMPVLIALAFLETSLIPGLISFVLIVAFGLVLRNYLSYLNLLMVARISTLIVLVITIIAAMSLIDYKLGLSTGITVTFFPMIIIAWTIERMSILWEEEGPKEVLVQGSGSLLVAVLAYGLMTFKPLMHLSFNFPELNTVVIALMLLMGQYTGYRLSELYRFRELFKDSGHAD